MSQSTPKPATAERTVRGSEEREAFLFQVGDAIRPLQDPASLLSNTCRLLGVYLGVNRVTYGEIEGDVYTVLNDYVDGVASLTGFIRWTDFTGAIGKEFEQGVLVVNDTETDPRTTGGRQTLKAAEIGSYLVPLLLKDGRVVGAFGIHSRAPRVWTADEITLVRKVTDRIWAALEQRRAEAALRVREERLAFLLKLNDTLRTLHDPSDVQEAAAHLLGEHLQVSRVGYAEIEGREYVIRCEYVRGVPPLAGHGPVGAFAPSLLDAYRRGEAVVVSDVRTDPRLMESERTALGALEIAAFVGVTLLKDGKVVAAFGANQATPRAWRPPEVELVRDVAERTWDAVQRARAEAALQEREQRLRLALEASGAGWWSRDVRAGHVYRDERYRRLYGFPSDGPVSFDAWLGRVHDADRPTVLRLLDEMRHKGRGTWDITFRIVRPEGDVSWIQSVGRAEHDASGNLTRLTGIELDVTERRRTEEAAQARRTEEHDRVLRTLLETATQGIASFDAQGTIVTANRALNAMFGYAAEDLIGQPIERLMPLSFRNGHNRSADVHLVGTREDRSTFPIEVSVNHVPTTGGGRAFAFVTDITERQHAASMLLQRTAELEYRTTQLRQMSSDLTLAEHHAREQIAKTLHDGVQQLLVSAALKLDSRVQHDVQQGAGADDLLVQVKGHLDEAIDAARSLSYELFPPVLEQSGLPPALAWLANWIRNKYGLEVDVSADPLANSARKDVRTLLFESVRELLFNAVKHARVDRVRVDLELTLEGMVSITVTDQGIGFDVPELVERAKTTQVGWGLFSIRERVALLGGRFDIDSAPGRGTRFCLLVPGDATPHAVNAREPLEQKPTLPTSPIPAGPVSADALRILIVDDHVTVREAFRDVLHLRRELYVVGEASNGFEALAQALALRPDVIVMDISMPLMDGVEATRRIRAELPFVQILGHSIQPRTQHRHEIEHAGAAGFFVKGVDTQRLIDYLLSIQAHRSGVQVK